MPLLGVRHCISCGLLTVLSNIGKATCPECQKINRKIHNQLYRARPEAKLKRKETTTAYRGTAKGKAVAKAANRRYCATLKGKLARHNAKLKRRHYLYASDNHLTASQWLDILKLNNYRCYYCKQKAPLTIDHVIPLSKGGLHIKENIVPACRSCNSSKNDKLVRLL